MPAVAGWADDACQFHLVMHCCGQRMNCRLGTARVLLMHPCVQDALKQLEGIVHPLVYDERRQWLQQHLNAGRHSVLVLDIPLLYETDAAGNVRPPPCLSLPIYRQVSAQAGR